MYESEADDADLKLIDFGFAHEVTPGNEAMWELMLVSCAWVLGG